MSSDDVKDPTADKAISPMQAWAHRHGKDIHEAARRLEKLPLSVTGNGLEVPFPYVDKEQQYKSQVDPDLVSKAIAAAPLCRVKLDEIHTMQHSVKPMRVMQYIEYPDAVPPGTKGHHGGPIDYPIIVRWKGKLLLHDGNHRVTAAKLRDEHEIVARCVDMDKVAEEGKAA